MILLRRESITLRWHSVIVVRISQIGIPLCEKRKNFGHTRRELTYEKKPKGENGGGYSRDTSTPDASPSTSLSWHNTALRYLWTAFGTCRAKLINARLLIKRMGGVFEVHVAKLAARYRDTWELFRKLLRYLGFLTTPNILIRHVLLTSNSYPSRHRI